MALVPFLLDKLVHLCVAPAQPKKLISAGYPDLLVNPSLIRHYLGNVPLEFHPDEAAIVKWHNCAKITDRIVESRFFFEQLNTELTVLDHRTIRGNELVHDLNQPLPAEFHGSYDIVLDTGTVEHCFNIGQAAMNLASLLGEGGVIVQTLPLSSFNHGFYNVNPTWFHDFYSAANGFEIIEIKGVLNLFSPTYFDPPPFTRFTGVPDSTSMFVMARRREMKPLAYPTQHKYVVNAELKG